MLPTTTAVALSQLADCLAEALLPDVRVDADGSLKLELDDGTPLAVSPSPDGEQLVFHAALARLSGPRDVLAMMAALACNLHQEETGGGAIGLDTESLALVLSWRRSAAQAGGQELVADLAQFAALALRLKARLEEALGSFSPQDLEEIERRVQGDPVLSTTGPLDSDARVSVFIDRA